MFLGQIPYRRANLLALSGWPLTNAVTLDFSHFANAGRISFIESPPSPTMAHPSFFPGGSGTGAGCCARASFSSAPATLVTARPWLTLLINPRREISGFSNSSMTCTSSLLGLLRVLLRMNLVQPLLQIFLILLLQFWIAWRTVNLARFVFSLVELLLGPLVVNVNHIGAIQNVLDELRRDKIHAFAVSNGEIAGHHGNAANPYRHVDPGEHHIADRGGIGGPKIAGHIDLRQSIKVSDAAVHHQSSGVGGLHHVIKQIVADDGSIHFLSE